MFNQTELVWGAMLHVFVACVVRVNVDIDNNINRSFHAHASNQNQHPKRNDCSHHFK